MLNIWTWNVNSIRSKIDKVVALLEKYNIDILVITETKIQPFHEAGINLLHVHDKYKIIFSSNKKASYHGVAVIFKKELKLFFVSNTLSHNPGPRLKITNMKNSELISSIPTSSLIEDREKAHVTEGRILTLRCELENGKSFALVATYVPNSGVNRTDPLKRLAYRILYWDKDLYVHLKNMEKTYGNVVWLGDLNVARYDNDIYKPKVNIAGTTQEERHNFDSFLKINNWIDTWDVCNPDKTKVTQRCTYGVEGTCKLRIDYILTSPSLKNTIKTSILDQQFEGSDHVPLGTVFDFS